MGKQTKKKIFEGTVILGTLFVVLSVFIGFWMTVGAYALTALLLIFVGGVGYLSERLFGGEL